MLGRILHLHRQIATAGVQVQRASLKDRALALIERRKRHKVVEQLQQVALKAQQFLQLLGVCVVCLLCLVFGDQRHHALRCVAGLQILQDLVVQRVE
ncbi:hypothetical protein D3C71_1949240 [compost metagenome]